MPLPLLPIAGGAALLYLLGKGKGAPAGKGNQKPGGASPAASAGADVAGDVTNDEKDILAQAMYCFRDGQVGDGYGTEEFFRQVWLPASRVPLSTITPYQWRLATYLIGGSLHRRSDLESLYVDYLKSIGAKAEDVSNLNTTGTVASVIPVVGQFLATMFKSLANTLQNAINSENMDVKIMVGDMKRSFDPKNLDPPGAMLLAPSWMQNGGEAPWDFNTVPYLSYARTGIEHRLPKAGWTVPAQYATVYNVKNTFTASTTFRYHRRWFAAFQYGLWLPWVSDELQGHDLRETINIRARVYRAMDAISCMFFPSMHGEAASQNIGADSPYYFYQNPTLGPIMGSVFPPTKEDGLIPGYGYGGKPLGNVAQGAANGPLTPANVPGYVPTGPAASTGNGEQFTSTQQAVQNSQHQVFNPPPPAPTPSGDTVRGAANGVFHFP